MAIYGNVTICLLFEVFFYLHTFVEPNVKIMNLDSETEKM